MLEDHAHVDAQRAGVHVKDVDAVELHTALVADAGHEVAHAVERAQQRGLTAAGRPDEGRAAVLGDGEVNALESLEVPVPEVEATDVHAALGRLQGAPGILGLGGRL